MNTENLSTLKINQMSQKKYDELKEKGTIQPNEIYLTPDEDVVDLEYNPASENAQSGKALSPVLQKKIELWKPNTEYKEGDEVLGFYQELDHEGYSYAIVMKCSRSHTSPDNIDYPNLAEDFDRCWTYVSLRSDVAYLAARDLEYNSIIETYATKEELNEAIAGIEIPEGGNITVDQSYNEESENPQSGKAVAEAVADKMNSFGIVAKKPKEDGSPFNERVIVRMVADKAEIENALGDLYLKGGESNFRTIILGDGYSSDVMLGTDESPQTVGGIATPTLDNQATNKKYVDDTIADTVGDIETTLDGIIEIQNSLIGGGSV